MTKKIQVQLIVYETGWILEAIAKQWKEKIDRISGFSCDISYGTIGFADIYIHLVYTKARLVSNARNIVYVTHINFSSKIKYIYRGVKNKAEFVTMSNMTTAFIKRIFPYSIAYTVLPESIHFLKTIQRKHLTLGLFFRIYEDNRKNNQAIQRLFEIVEKQAGKLRLIIYGQGFEKFISNSNAPFVIYDQSTFKKKTYETYLKKCDYVVNYAFDEGAISILDAATLNVPVLTSKQGYHLDINLPLGSFLFSQADEINEKIQEILDYSFKDKVTYTMDRTLEQILKKPKHPELKSAFIVFLYYCLARFRFNPIREKNDLYNSLNKIFRFDKFLNFLKFK